MQSLLYIHHHCHRRANRPRPKFTLDELEVLVEDIYRQKISERKIISRLLFPYVLLPMKGPSVNEHLYACRKGYMVHHGLNRHIQSVADANYNFFNMVARWPGIVLTTRSYGAIVIWQLTWSKGKLRVGCWVIVPIHCRSGY